MASRTATLLLLSFPVVAACASSRVIVAGDAGLADSATPPLDAAASGAGPNPGADAGPEPAGVCAESAAAAPLGVLAVRVEGDAVLGLEAGGTVRRLHRVFTGTPIRGEVAAGALLASPERVAGVVSAELDCARPSCPRTSEVFVITPDGVTTVDVQRPAGFRDPTVVGVTGDGLLQLRLVRERTFASFTRVLDVAAGEVLGDLGCCTSLAGRSEADAEGWRPATLAGPDDVRTRAGFVRFVAGATETRDLGFEGAQAWRDAWVRWDRQGVHIDRVSGRRSVRFTRDVAGRQRTPRLTRAIGADPGLLELWAEGELHGVVALETERVTLFAAPLVGGPVTDVETRVGHGRWLAAVGGAPRHTVDLMSGVLQDHVLPDGFAPLDAQYCTPAPSLLPGGGFALLLRGPERTGAYVLDAGGGSPQPVGLALRDVAFGSVLPAGPLFAVFATDGRMTFCPSVEPSDAPPAEGELVGDSFQIVDAEGAQRLGEGESLFGYLDPEGRCAMLGHGSRPTEVALLDLTTDERAPLPTGVFWQPLASLPLHIF